MARYVITLAVKLSAPDEDTARELASAIAQDVQSHESVSVVAVERITA